MRPAAVQASKSLLRAQAVAYVYHSGVHDPKVDPSDLLWDMEVVYSDLDELLSGARDPYGTVDLVEKATRQIVSRDYYFLITQAGRPGRRRGSKQTGPGAPFISHMLRYGCEGQSTGWVEFDNFFAKAVRTLPQIWADREGELESTELAVGAALVEVAKVYWRHYPLAQGRLQPVFRQLLCDAG